MPGRPPPVRLRGQRRPARRGGGPGRCAARAGLEQHHGGGQRHLRGAPGRARRRGPGQPRRPGQPLARRPAQQRSGTGGSRSPAGRASTASASRRTGGRPGSSRSARSPATGAAGTGWAGGAVVGDARRGRPWPGHRAARRRRRALRGAVGPRGSDRHSPGHDLRVPRCGSLPRPCWRSRAPAMTSRAGLVRRQADEICTMALTAMRRLGLAGLATPVVLGGGVLAARDPLLTAGVIEGIRAGAPHAAVRITDVAPVAGAALLGLDRLGAGPDSRAPAAGRLRRKDPAMSRVRHRRSLPAAAIAVAASLLPLACTSHTPPAGPTATPAPPATPVPRRPGRARRSGSTRWDTRPGAPKIAFAMLAQAGRGGQLHRHRAAGRGVPRPHGPQPGQLELPLPGRLRAWLQRADPAGELPDPGQRGGGDGRVTGLRDRLPRRALPPAAC